MHNVLQVWFSFLTDKKRYMTYVNREIADKYQEFFNFMNQEHDLVLTIEQMDEIVFETQRLVKKLTIPVVVGRGEQLVCDCPIPNATMEVPHRCIKCNKPIKWD